MQPEVKKADQAIEFETDERCHITEVANDSGDEFVSIARARVEPGVERSALGSTSGSPRDSRPALP